MEITPRIASTFAAAALQRLETMGATVPKAVREDHAALADLIAKRRALPTRCDFPAAVLDSLAAGNDPSTDPAVHHQLMLREILANEYGIQYALDARAAAFLSDHTDAILDAFSAPFAKAAATLTEAHAVIGDDVDLNDTAKIINAGGAKAAEAWARAQGALATIEQIVLTWRELTPGIFLRGTRPLLIADIPAATWLDDELDREGGALNAWELLRRGYTLDYAGTRSGYTERLLALPAEREHRNATAANHQRHAAGAMLRHTA